MRAQHRRFCDRLELYSPGSAAAQPRLKRGVTSSSSEVCDLGAIHEKNAQAIARS